MPTVKPYELWINEERTVLVTIWNTGQMTVATRETTADVWGPPIYLKQ